MANLKNSRHIAAATASFNSGPSIGIAGEGDYALPSSASGATSGDVLTFTNAGLQWTAPAGGSISSLSGVNITAPSNGQVLKYDGSNWVNGTDDAGSGGTGGATTLSALTDVSISSPSNGQLLAYSTTSSTWESTTINTAGPFSMTSVDIGGGDTNYSIAVPAGGAEMVFAYTGEIKFTSCAGIKFQDDTVQTSAAVTAYDNIDTQTENFTTKAGHTYIVSTGVVGSPSGAAEHTATLPATNSPTGTWVKFYAMGDQFNGSNLTVTDGINSFYPGSGSAIQSITYILNQGSYFSIPNF